MSKPKFEEEQKVIVKQEPAKRENVDIANQKEPIEGTIKDYEEGKWRKNIVKVEINNNIYVFRPEELQQSEIYNCFIK